MPLEREVAYWDKVARLTVDGARIKADNTWKRRHQIKRLLEHTWMEEKVLEIGVGNGLVAGALQLAARGQWQYIGTELSDRFMETVRQSFGLRMVKADVRELPEGPFTRIIALDSLEHVRPEHREAGYKRIADVAAEGALLFIHLSHEKSYHEKEFDHPFGLEDLIRIEGNGFHLVNYERYVCDHRNGPMDYAFVVMRKCK